MSTISKPNTFSSNTSISSSQVNANFDTIYNDYNGGISAANLASNAITTAKIADDAVTTAKIADANVTHTEVAAGFPVQVVTATFSAVATGTTIMPSDDTIPQNTEGDQYMTLAITPKSATNRLFIEAKVTLANSSVASVMTSALFQDSTANALAVGNVVYAAANYQVVNMIGHDMVAGTTSSTTFKIRSGSGIAGTTTFNGAVGARLYGGISYSYIKITEYKA